jgi:hypothetical protein
MSELKDINIYKVVKKEVIKYVISGFSCSIHEIDALLGLYALQNGSFILTCQDYLSIPPPRAKLSRKIGFQVHSH